MSSSTSESPRLGLAKTRNPSSSSHSTQPRSTPATWGATLMNTHASTSSSTSAWSTSQSPSTARSGRSFEVGLPSMIVASVMSMLGASQTRTWRPTGGSDRRVGAYGRPPATTPEERAVQSLPPIEVDAHLTELVKAQHVDPVLDDMERRADAARLPDRRACGRPVPRAAGPDGRARRVVELGSGFGYSAYWFARAVGEDGEVVCTDSDPANAGWPRATCAGPDGGTRCATTSATRWRGWPPWTASWTSSTATSTRTDYPAAWAAAAERLRVGGLFLCDNVLWDGRVAGLRGDSITIVMPRASPPTWTQVEATRGCVRSPKAPMIADCTAIRHPAKSAAGRARFTSGSVAGIRADEPVSVTGHHCSPQDPSGSRRAVKCLSHLGCSTIR
jgi:caffeoyl-CoA O-methyltransferase